MSFSSNPCLLFLFLLLPRPLLLILILFLTHPQSDIRIRHPESTTALISNAKRTSGRAPAISSKNGKGFVLAAILCPLFSGGHGGRRDKRVLHFIPDAVINTQLTLRIYRMRIRMGIGGECPSDLEVRTWELRLGTSTPQT